MRFKPAMLFVGIICLCFVYYTFIRKKQKIVRTNIFNQVNKRSLVYSAMPPYQRDCTFHSCFHVPNCLSPDENKITVGIHPHNDILPREYLSMIKSIKTSDQFLNDHTIACITVLPFILDPKKPSFGSIQIRNSSDEETNYLIFDLAPRLVRLESLRTGKAMIASGAFTEETYRQSYDVAIPMFNPLTAHLHLSQEKRSRLLVVAQVAIPGKLRAALQAMADQRDDILILQRCETSSKSYYKRCSSKGTFDYPQVLKTAKFCGIAASRQPVEQTVLFDAMKAGCVPVLLDRSYVLPFSEVLDWRRCSIRVAPHRIAETAAVLEGLGPGELLHLRRHLRHFFHSYMASVRKIALTALRLIADRARPRAARSLAEWNEPGPDRRQMPPAPLFYPLAAPPGLGFTAVILTYNRFPALCRLLRRLAPTPSLRRIVVVWNNPEVAPPPVSQWPPLGKSVTIVRSLRNSLNNRFTPFEEIDTEAVLSMDDDLDMLSPDELEFGFRLWSRHTDRLVGIPGRLHWRDNATGAWRYDSEWKSELSMVLTGAAFFHKYYGQLYRTRMPGAVSRYVDENMVCEDIAMNFLIAHLSGKAALKVTPRKKFRCPACLNSSSSLRTVRRLRERSLCLAAFAPHFAGSVPLRTVDFRVDPLLLGGPPDRPVDAFRGVGRV